MIMKVRLTASQARDYNIVNGFFMGGFEIEVVPDRNPELPPLVERDWQHGRVEGEYSSSPAEKQERSLTVVTIGREEDGVIHSRRNPLTYERRPSRMGGKVVQCKSWAKETRDLERLAESLGFENLDSLLSGLAANGIPEKPARQKAASDLNRSLSSVTAKLRDLRRKALVSHK